MSPGPWSHVLLALGALGAGCYSPSIESCRIACAAGETCPSGLTCVNGRCAAAAGETCLGDDGGLPGGCGDGLWMPGEICFGSAIMTTTTLPDTIHQLQLANVDDDPDLEIVLTAGTSLHVYEVQGDALVPRAPVTVETVGVVRALQLDGTQADELVVVAQTELRVLALQGGAYATVQDATLDVDSDPPVVVRPGRFRDSSRTFVVGSTAKVAVASVGEELAISILRSTPFDKVADVAAGQLDDDPEDELAIVTSESIALWDADLENPVGGPLAIAGASRAVLGDFFGDATPELVYAKQAGDEVPGELGVVRVRTGIAMFIEDDTVEGLVGALEATDLDGDGRSDLVSLQAGSTTNNVLVWRGGDSLGTPHRIEVPIVPVELAPPADLTGDGVPDLVITDGSTLVLLPSSR